MASGFALAMTMKVSAPLKRLCALESLSMTIGLPDLFFNLPQRLT
jgi:hypothetical protein